MFTWKMTFVWYNEKSLRNIRNIEQIYKTMPLQGKTN
jgi:hypothetical protein